MIPPSAKTKACAVSTTASTRQASHGPRRTAASAAPSRWPLVPPATGKLSIWAAKMNAPVTPSSGIGLVIQARLRAAEAVRDRARRNDAGDGGHPGVEEPVGDVHVALLGLRNAPVASRPQQRISRRAQPPIRVGSTMSGMHQTLLLFDIDGTLLLRATREHLEALHDGIREVYGVGDSRSVRVEAGGRTDLEIARHILLELGVTARRIDEGLRDLRAGRDRGVHAPLPGRPVGDRRARDGRPARPARRSRRRPAEPRDRQPGADRLAQAQARRARPPLRTRSGRLRFRSRGPHGAARRSRAAGRGASGAPHPPERTVVIGDTPRDIACARADGSRVVAITTGPFAADDLRGADAVVDDPAGLERALGAL